MSRPLGEVPLGTLAEALASRGPGPAAGSTAAATTALAAGLAGKVARGAARTDPAALDLAHELDGLRTRALTLADDDVAAFSGFLAARKAPGGAAAATEAIVQVPMDVLAAACRVAEIAAALAEHGPDALTGDAVTAALLAAAAAESASALVGANIADTGEVVGGLDGWGDPRVEDAEERAGEARRLAERAAF
ncbi:cyclodeaminase/cyclohydrolase family protein [Actinomycetospora sp. TBRC 11914]|uniref:cyclodeaminase/cyclohydrolase family protein n=1 Tax=Actinomycetospora sp. TBRC 11914 TaxID=2729387 RepID=UPI00145CD29E|nr:cyclodeaminase/cyclohydrolase family protein [Actinomycetospora sp. TBRC 11914]NMO92114.1 cyclodeaminase/cyclohydrolase family protein [Actinomycetospora sp. TBRC 11914]